MNIDKSVIFDGLRSLTTKSSSTSTPWKALKLALNLIFFCVYETYFPVYDYYILAERFNETAGRL